MRLFYFSILFFCFSVSASVGTEDQFEYDSLDVQGQFEPKKSAADKLKNYRAQLEQKHERMVKRQIEKIRYQHELRLMKEMNKRLQALESNLEKI